MARLGLLSGVRTGMPGVSPSVLMAGGMFTELLGEEWAEDADLLGERLAGAEDLSGEEELERVKSSLEEGPGVPPARKRRQEPASESTVRSITPRLEVEASARGRNLSGSKRTCH